MGLSSLSQRVNRVIAGHLSRSVKRHSWKRNQQSDINNNHNSLSHTHTHAPTCTNSRQPVIVKYAELDVYECPSSFLWQEENSDRMKSSSTRLLCYRSLLSTLFADWQKRTLEEEGGLLGLNTIIVFLSLYWSARMSQRRRKRDREAEKQSERHQLQSQKWKEAGIALSSPHNNAHNHYRRAKTMQMLPCAE